MISISRLTLLVLALAACSKHSSYEVPAASSTVPPPAPVSLDWHFVVDPHGTMHVDMPAAKQHIQGATSAAMGSIEIVGNDLAQSRGSVMIDLASFSTSTFGNKDDDAQTKQAHLWLQTARDDQRWASLAIRSIDGLSATDLSKVAPSADGGDDVRTVTMTVHGDLLLHDSKVPEDCSVEVRFHYPAGALADSRPSRIELTLKEPMRVFLKDVDVQPRDAHGKPSKWTADLLAKVSPYADITVNLNATPAM